MATAPVDGKLFNVIEDIGCARDLAAQEPDLVRELMALAEQARRELGDAGRNGTGQRPVGRVEHPMPPRATSGP